MKAVIFLALLGVAVASAHLFSESEYQFLFSKWIAQHNKKYNHENFFYRYTVFKHNLDHITVHNKKQLSYTLGMNAFGDLTPEEFKATYASGYKSTHNTHMRSKNVKILPHVPADKSLDWRTKGGVNAVKNQQQCGSCWAFSATGSMEGLSRTMDGKDTGKLLNLSEQQLVDCSQAQGNQGCNGGLMDNAFQFVIANGGICDEKSYPYVAQDQTCQTTCKNVFNIKGFTDVQSGSEDQLMSASTKTPVSIAIEADQQVFQFYSGGVLDDASCGTQLDHGVLVVGYGTSATEAKPYWIVKNSWGAQWGEKGYIRMVRGKNQCGLSAEPSYPYGGIDL